MSYMDFHSSAQHPYRPGRLPCWTVIRQLAKGGPGDSPWVIHDKYRNEDGAFSYGNGEYFEDYPTAVQCFKTRCRAADVDNRLPPEQQSGQKVMAFVGMWKRLGLRPHGFSLRDQGDGKAQRYVVQRAELLEDGTLGYDDGAYFKDLHFAWQEFQFRVAKAHGDHGAWDPAQVPCAS